MDVWSGVGQCFPPLAFALPYLRFFITWLFKKWLIEVFNLCRLYLSHCFSVHTLRTIIGILLVKIQGDSIFMEYLIVSLTATDCVLAKLLELCLTLCDPMDSSCQAPLSQGFSRHEYWSGLPCPPPGDLPNPGIKPMSLMSPALADRFFTTTATWEALVQRPTDPVA